MKKILIILFIALLTTPLFSTTYYVATTGTDGAGHSGAVGDPWLTLAYACTRVTTAGDVIHINAGTYTCNTGAVVALGVSIEGDGDTSILTTTALTSDVGYGDAIINMNSEANANGSHTISYLKFDGNDLTGGMAINSINRNNVKIHHCTFIDFNWSAVAWAASGVSEAADGAPSTYVTGSEFYNNTVTNCAGMSGWHRGALLCGGHQGMLIHDNTMIEGQRGNQEVCGWPIKFWYWGGWMLGCKIYDNYLELTQYSGFFDFAIEGCWVSGLEIYGNTIIGSIDMNDQLMGLGYDYSVWVHDNTIGPATHIVSNTVLSGLTIEFQTDTYIIERNWFRNLSPAILFTPRQDLVDNVTIRYNIMTNVWADGWYKGAIVVNGPLAGFTMNNLHVYNNVISAATAASTESALQIFYNDGVMTAGTGIQMVNNIIQNFDVSPMNITAGDIIGTINFENNLVYNCGNSNVPTVTGTPDTYTIQNNIVGQSPSFVTDGSDYHLQNDSPALNTGKNLSLSTDYDEVAVSNPPEIGAYEYTTGGEANPIIHGILMLNGKIVMYNGKIVRR